MASVIINKALTTFSTGFGSAFTSALVDTIQPADSNRVGCARGYNAAGVIGNVEPTGDQSKVEFYLFNDDGSAQTMYSNLTNNFSTFQSNVVSRLGSTYSPSTLEQVSVTSVDDGSSGLSYSAIAVIVVGSVVGAILLILLICCFFRCCGSRKSDAYSTRGDSKTATTSNNEVEMATGP